MRKLEFVLQSFPVLRTSRLVLRQIVPDDREALFRLFSNEKVAEFNDIDALTTVDEVDRIMSLIITRFYNKTGVRWGITSIDDSAGEVIGTIGFNSFRTYSHSGIVGYDLLPDFWGRGFMTEALQRVVKWGFENLQLNRIEAHVTLPNHASARVLQKCGFIREGILREGGYWKEEYHDLQLFSILHRDYINNRTIQDE